jgi:hypothetical protein
VNRAATDSPSACRRFASVAFEGQGERIGQPTDISGPDQVGRPLRHFGHRRPFRRDQGCPAGQRFESGQSEALFEGWVCNHRAPTEQGGDRRIGKVPSADDPVAVTCRGESPLNPGEAPADLPTQHQDRLALCVGHPIEGGDERVDPLSGLEGAHEGDQWAILGHTAGLENGRVGPGSRFERRESPVVDPVGCHDNRCPDFATGL